MVLLAILIAIFAWILGLFLPWWSMAIPCFLLGSWLGKKSGASFLAGFLGIGILWFIQTLTIHIANDGILTTRIAELFTLPHPLLVILVTILIGGLAGGLSTLTGYFFGEAFVQKKVLR
ncbi:MAG: hypothetical protein ACNS64_03510 [Candidatus Halalkalibacterium sp. M3_1C_030]